MSNGFRNEGELPSQKQMSIFLVFILKSISTSRYGNWCCSWTVEDLQKIILYDLIM